VLGRFCGKKRQIRVQKNIFQVLQKEGGQLKAWNCPGERPPGANFDYFCSDRKIRKLQHID